MKSILVVFAFVLLSVATPAKSSSAGLKELYEQHRWFELRDALRGDSSEFFKAAVQTAFHEPGAEKSLNALVRSAGSQDERFEVRELLLGLYFRAGRYSDACSEARQTLREKPDAADVINILPTLELLEHTPDQKVIGYKPQSTSIRIEDGNVIVPLRIGGSLAHYILDNGFSLSGISQSEAKRLGLRVLQSKTKIDTMNGAPVQIRVAIAHDLAIAGVHLRNVAFYVLPDGQPPFDSLRAGRKGIVGLPVLLALGGFSWNPEKHVFRVPKNQTTAHSAASNLAFDGTSIFTQVMFRNALVNFSLDTGAQKSVLYPGLADTFPALKQQGRSEDHTIAGVGGSSTIDSVSLPELRFTVGGKDVVDGVLNTVES